ncbi:hypothetical protein PINS_up016945 [Pythium insidiosum]|nr:hypothetical protein PINS_up016945 [Pythium insidiosum]
MHSQFPISSSGFLFEKSQSRASLRRNMSDVELKCAVYGDATVFPVKIARDAKVSALQEAVASVLSSTQQHSVPPRLVTLYLAHKNGAWLKHDESVPSFSRGEIDTQYKKMCPSWRLTNKELFGSGFVLGERENSRLGTSFTATTNKNDEENGTRKWRRRDCPTASKKETKKL